MSLLDVVHPAAKCLVDIARSQDAEVRGGGSGPNLADFFALFGSGRAKLYINGRKMDGFGVVWSDLEHFVDMSDFEKKKKKSGYRQEPGCGGPWGGFWAEFGGFFGWIMFLKSRFTYIWSKNEENRRYIECFRG
jgi:hypothetical protein